MNRNDRRIALTAIIIGTIVLIGLWLTEGAKQATEVNITAKDSTSNEYHETHRKHASSSMTIGDVPMRHTEEFPFDPNTADSTQLLRLGLHPFQVRSIYRYRAQGGVFRTKRDFAQLYGLTKKDYLRLEPYIRISDDYQPASTLFQKDERDTLRYPVKIKDGEHITLNTADTTQLMRVPGIGSYYAKEIIRHGKWIGGYVNVNQLDEIDGFPQSAKKYFVINHPTPQRININKLSLQELRRHPYINYYQAKAIIDYRRLHGDIKNLQDLRFSKDFSEDAIQRLEPYIEY
ncbi:MAG: helix-hairpin-helix domain-containing protein [Prevotella sp.]|nr:helix-hairpin-helix domain-containing protein [Prevotella sp.]